MKAAARELSRGDLGESVAGTVEATAVGATLADGGEESRGREGKTQALTVAFQVLGVLGIGVYCLVISQSRPNNVGFFCNDDSIRFPLLPQTVPPLELCLITQLIPLGLMLLCEVAAWLRFGRLMRSDVEFGCWRASGLLALLYQSVGGFAFSMISCCAITYTAKMCVGRLRPHFLAVCQPNWTQVQCSDSSGFLYVDNFECLGTNQAAIREARVSFPSGHSSESMCSMLYLMLFLHARLVWQRPAHASPAASKAVGALWRLLLLFRPFLQIGAFCLAIFIGLSRVKDRYHHPTDVIAGLALGVVCAVFSAVYVARLSKAPLRRKQAADETSLNPCV